MDFHMCRDFEAVRRLDKTGGTDVSIEATINLGHVQSNLTVAEPLEAKCNFKEEGEFRKEESEDIASPSLLPTTARHQKDSGGQQHGLLEGVNGLLVIIKTDPDLETIKTDPDLETIKTDPYPEVIKTLLDPEETNPSMHSSGEQHILQHLETSEPEGESQHAPQNCHSSLVVIKMEPDEGQPISGGDNVTEPQLGEGSDLPPVCKTEADHRFMPNSACGAGDPQLLIRSMQHADNGESLEEHEDFIGSGESSQPHSAAALGKEPRGLKSFCCTECGNTFSKSSSFYRHMRIHSGERPYKCTQCNKTFSQSASFKVHQRIHTGEKPYQCSDCGKTFRRLDNLQIHQRTHSGEKPYKCSLCPKTFTRLDVLQIHQRTHTGVKPYQCSHCCKTFTRLSVFQVHQRIHTGERPYQCSTCEKHFVDASNLKNHERTHTLERPYQCAQCDRTFIQLAHLTSHKRKHTGEKPYHCTICGKSYTASSTLLYHRRKHTASSMPT